MCSVNVFQIAMDLNGPPGLTHPLLQEKYSWVDQRLREMYYGYSLTADNSDEFEEIGLLTENYAWVDRKLEEMCAPPSDDDFALRYIKPTPIYWGGLAREGVIVKAIEDSDESTLSGYKRKRSESDISDYEVEAGRVIKRLRCQSPILGKSYISVSYDYDEAWEVESALSSITNREVHCVTPADEYDFEESNIIEATWPEGAQPIISDYYSDYESDYESDLDLESAKVWPADNVSEVSNYDFGYDSF